MAAGRSRGPSVTGSRFHDRPPAHWGPRKVDASRPLLFERLTGIGDEDGEPLAEGALYGRDELMASIERELAALFNTRAPVSADVLASRKRTTIDYGIPDLSLYSPASTEARAALAVELQNAVIAYEPRLLSPRVTVAPHPSRERQLSATVEGNIRLDTIVEHISFRIELPNGRGDGG